MRVVISKLLDDKVTFETRLKEGLRDSHMKIGGWRGGLALQAEGTACAKTLSRRIHAN